VSFIATSGLTQGASTITLAAPAGTTFAPNACNNYFLTDTTTNGSSNCDTAVLSNGNATVTLTSGLAVGAGDSVTLVANAITNTSTTGSLHVDVSTSNDTTPVSLPLSITTPTAVTSASVTPTSHGAGATQVTYDVQFTATSGLTQGFSVITVAAPAGTVFPAPACDVDFVTDVTASQTRNCNGGSVANGGATLQLVPGIDIPAGHAVDLTLNGVANPSSTGSLHVDLSTTSDATAVSMALSIAAPTSVGSATLTPTAHGAGATQVSYDVQFTPTSGLTHGFSVITVAAPAGTVFPAPACDVDFVTDVTANQVRNCNQGTVTNSGATLQLTPSIDLPAGHSVDLTLNGITNTATTGSLSVALSTTSDTASVSLPLSISAATSVASASLTPTAHAAGATQVTYAVQFTATSALTRNFSVITLAAPAGTVFPAPACDVDFVTDVTASVSHNCNTGSVTNGGATLQLTPTLDIPAGHVVALSLRGITNTSTTGSLHLDLSTTSDTSIVSLPLPITASTAVGGATLATTSTASGATGVTYTVQFTATSGLTHGFSTIVLAAPAGTLFPPVACSEYFVFDDTQSTGTNCNAGSVVNSGATLQLVTNVDIAPGDAVRVVAHDITNAVASGPNHIDLSTSSDQSAVSLPITYTGGGSVGGLTVALGDQVVGAPNDSATLHFTTSGALPAGSSTITLTAPPSTQLPTGGCQYDLVDEVTQAHNNCQTVGVTNGGRTVTITPTITLGAGDSIQLSITAITNPTAAGSSTIDIATSVDPVVASAPIVIVPGATVSGTITGAGNPLSAAPVQVCPVGGSPCWTVLTDGLGHYAIGAPAGSVALTASPPAFGGPNVTQASTNLTVTSGTPLTGVDLDEPAAQAIPAGTTLNGTANGFYSWGGSYPYVTQGCANGIGEVLLRGSTASGAPNQLKVIPMTETPPGSGTYTATLPPLWPWHGTVQFNNAIACMPNTAIAPTGGSTAGGDDVRIFGDGFTGTTAVDFGVTPAESFTVVSDHELHAVAPAGHGQVGITVTNASGASDPDPIATYTYMAVSSVTPATAAPGAPVTISGEGFTSADMVYFGGYPTRDIQVVDDHTITAIVPPGVGSNVDVQVGAIIRFSPPGAGDSFTFGPSGGAPVHRPLASRPSTERHAARPGPGPRAGGGRAGFKDLCSALKLLGRSCPSLPSPGNWPSMIDNSFPAQILAGELNSIAACVEYVGAGGNPADCKPFSFSFDPSGAVVDTNGNPVVGATVTVERAETQAGPFAALPTGSPLMTPSINPQTTGADGTFHWDVVGGWYEVTASKSGCTVPGQPAQTTVSTAALPVPPPQVGLTLTLQCPTSVAAPSVTNVAPATVPGAGGTGVAITGTGFTGVTAVHFGGVAAAGFTVLGPTSIVATAPPGAGAQDVTVDTGGGTTSATAADIVQYVGAPTLTNVAPATGGTPAGGDDVVLTGTGFTAVGSVLVNGEPAQFAVTDDTTIHLTTPPGTGMVDVAVVSPDCGASVPDGTTSCGASNPMPFSYSTPAPVALSVTPATATAGDTVTFVVTPLVAAKGTVTIVDGTTTIAHKGTKNGSATIATTKLTGGPHLLHAVLTPTGGSAQSSPTRRYDVQRAPTQTVVTTSAASLVAGQKASLHADVTRLTTTGGRASGGIVAFSDGGQLLGTAKNGAKGATLKARLGAGPHNVVATFLGSASDLASTSASRTKSVGADATALTLTVKPTSAAAGAPVTFSAVVKRVKPGAGAISGGTVQFSEGDVLLGEVAVVKGKAKLTTSALGAGAHTITATYTGDTSDGASAPKSIGVTMT
jgi:hypothetical protein